MSRSNIIIELKSLSKRYGYGDTESFALRDFDFTIKRGEFIMIMGPSGCGKTTLLNILGLLDRATSGEYFLNGESVANISSARQAKLRAKKIGFIFQNFNLIDNLPIIENVALPLIYAGYGKTNRLKIASNTLERFNLQKREYYFPHQLSGGQQQHVAIARAIVGSPEIILADEPTGNLDSRSSKNVMDILKSIHEEGNTIIMVTHNPSLTTYATRVIHMLDGQIDTDIKTVADWDLPQPIAVKIKRRRLKKQSSADSTPIEPYQPATPDSESLPPTESDNQEPKITPEPESKTESKTEPEPESELTSEPEPESKPEDSASEPKPTPELKSDPAPTPESQNPASTPTKEVILPEPTDSDNPSTTNQPKKSRRTKKSRRKK